MSAERCVLGRRARRMMTFGRARDKAGWSLAQWAARSLSARGSGGERDWLGGRGDERRKDERGWEQGIRDLGAAVA